MAFSYSALSQLRVKLSVSDARSGLWVDILGCELRLVDEKFVCQRGVVINRIQSLPWGDRHKSESITLSSATPVH